MGNNNKKTKNDDLRIIQNSMKKLLQLEETEKKIHRAQRSEIDTIHAVLNRYCDDREIKEKIAKNEEAFMLLQQAKNLISALRELLRR